MPVEKYRSVEDMPRPTHDGDTPLSVRIRALWNRSRALTPGIAFVRGVQRFRSIEEANAAREREVLRRMRSSAE
jgi:hypothetical protein